MCFRRKKMIFVDKLEESKQRHLSKHKTSTDTTGSFGKIFLFMIICGVVIVIVYFIIFVVRLYSGEIPIR